jgi:tripartite ATP-independent transporter DctP family solute receptor
MRRKLYLLLAVLIALSLVIAGCAQKAVEQSPAAADEATPAPTEEPTPEPVEPVIMKVGHSHSTEAPRHISLLKFEELVEEKTGGAVDVQIFPAGQLGSEQEMVEAVKLGTLQGSRSGMFDLVTNQLSIYMMPFLFDDVESFQQITRGPIGDKIAATANDVGIEIIATGDAGGFRQWSNNVRPIKSPDDMKGLKMRAPGVITIQETLKAFGANVVTIAYNELYQALKTGVADGQENPFVNIVDKKFYEVQKYLTVANYQVHPDPFYVNKEWLDGLDADLKQAIIDSAKEMYVYSDQLMIDANEAGLQTVIDSGVDVYELTPEERQVFIEACQPVYDKFIADGVIDEDLFNEVLAALGK